MKNNASSNIQFLLSTFVNRGWRKWRVRRGKEHWSNYIQMCNIRCIFVSRDIRFYELVSTLAGAKRNYSSETIEKITSNFKFYNNIKCFPGNRGG